MENVIFSFVRCLAVLTTVLLLSVAQNNTAESYCNRIHHSIVIVNHTLYIDGGEIRSVSTANPSNISILIPSTISTLDLSKPFSNSVPSLWSAPGIPKTPHPNNPSPPTLNSGALFADSQNLYLYGGSISVANPAINAPKALPDDGVWQYSFSTQQWSVPTLNGAPVQRNTLGASVQSSSGKSYYLGGVKQPASDPFFWTVKGAYPYMTPGLLTFDPSTTSFANASTTDLNALGTSAQGFLAVIESLGSQGLLISFGGWSNTANTAMNVTDDQLLNPYLRQNLSTISVYDIASNTWYQQPATGDIPRWRYVGCSVLVAAQDKSSYSIYVYAGWGSTFGDSDGDVYVLSLPSFRWIRVNADSGERSRHQCVLAGRNTMMVVGGIVPLGDFPIPTWTSQGCDTNSTIFQQGLGLFNLNNHSWSGTWDPDAGASPYQVHSSISKVIGGGSQGEATLMGPQAGWSQPELGRLFTNTSGSGSNVTATKPTSSGVPDMQQSHHLSTGGITGIAIASSIALTIIVLMMVWVFLHRRRAQPSGFGVNELDTHNYVRELAIPENLASSTARHVWRLELDTGIENVAELGNTWSAPAEKQRPPVSKFSATYEKPLPKMPEKALVELCG